MLKEGFIFIPNFSTVNSTASCFNTQEFPLILKTKNSFSHIQKKKIYIYIYNRCILKIRKLFQSVSHKSATEEEPN